MFDGSRTVKVNEKTVLLLATSCWRCCPIKIILDWQEIIFLLTTQLILKAITRLEDQKSHCEKGILSDGCFHPLLLLCPAVALLLNDDIKHTYLPTCAKFLFLSCYWWQRANSCYQQTETQSVWWQMLMTLSMPKWQSGKKLSANLRWEQGFHCIVKLFQWHSPSIKIAVQNMNATGLEVFIMLINIRNAVEGDSWQQVWQHTTKQVSYLKVAKTDE